MIDALIEEAKMKISTRYMLAGWIIVALGACATTEIPDVTHDGLVRNPDAAAGYVYVKPGVDPVEYQSFSVVPCDVAFRKNWLRDQNAARRSPSQRVKEKDMESIRTKLAEMCTEEFNSVLLTAPSYELVPLEEAGATTLVLKPHIIDLDVVAPDVQSPSMSRTYTTESGEMTLFLEIADASTGETLYRIVDRRRNLRSMRLQWSNSVTNTAEARSILNAWGKQFRDGLDRVYSERDQGNND